MVAFLATFPAFAYLPPLLVPSSATTKASPTASVTDGSLGPRDVLAYGKQALNCNTGWDDRVVFNKKVHQHLLTQQGNKLLFLVRDWNFPTRYPYGHQGGKTVLERILTVNEDQEPAHQDIREGLGKSFEELECYLMPHIGMRAIRDEDFDGQLNRELAGTIEFMLLVVNL
ncbi:atlastin-3-like [Hyalella azteca]|uniref:Atlastin-3-like n=1 Tax=Hyalella azteca TaxID=294128 RepID=A0A8B7NZF6_HYAAZ|nr:atlastin-3-like [Hyalella azteca]